MIMKKRILIIIGFAHLLTTPGKRSPDGKFREAIYSREVGRAIKAKLEALGYTVAFDYDGDKLPKTMQTPMAKLEQQRELALRVANVNQMCKDYGAANVIYISIHVNAAGSDGKWHEARGWQVNVSPKASSKSKLLAGSLFDAAKGNGLKMRQPSASQKYWNNAGLYILSNTTCPAVLTENLFQDNKEDVAYLMSDEGRHAIERLHVEGIVDYIQKYMS